MAKIESLDTITSGYLANEQINSNFTKVTTALNNTLSLDGSTPNSMSGDFDMDSNFILNLATPTSDYHAATKKYVDDNNASSQVAAAAASASAASTSASAAATSASAASTSETNAAASETAAATSESNAATSETNAAASEVDAESSASAVAINWAFDDGTSMADPSSGNLRFNNATVSSVTALAISANTAETGSPDLSDFIVTWDDDGESANRGTLIIRKRTAPATFAIFNVTGTITDNTSWLQVSVSHVASSGSFTDADDLYVNYTRAGSDGSLTEIVGDLTPQLGGDLDVNSNKITSTTAGNIVLEPDTTGAIVIGGNSTQPTELRFLEDSDNGTNYVGFKSASTLAGNQVWTLPTADGTTNQSLITNGSGGLSFASSSGVLLDETTFSSTASYEIDNTLITSAFDRYLIILDRVKPATDNVALELEISTNNGSSYLADSLIKYHYSRNLQTSTTYGTALNEGGVNLFQLAAGVGNATGEGVSMLIEIINPLESDRTHIVVRGGFINQSHEYTAVVGGGFHDAASALNNFLLSFSSGNIASGIAQVRGL